MLTIRLTRVGKKNSPAYRVVVADKKRAVKRKFIEILGHYNPTLKPKEIVINKDRAVFWMGNGAQPSDTVRNLMCDLNYLPKDQKVKKTFGKKFTKKQIKEGLDKAPEAPKAEVQEENLAASKEEEVAKTDEAAPSEPAQSETSSEEPENTKETKE